MILNKLYSEEELRDKIKFVAYHRPSMKDGIYTISVRPDMTVDDEQKVNPDGGVITKKFQVSGIRFSMVPKEVHSVFPPAGNLGDYDNVLPHIMLNKTTLPWERFADTKSEGVPFLALLVFDGSDEIPIPKVITLGDLLADAKAKHFPEFEMEEGQNDTDKVIVIDVDNKLLKKIMPLKSDLTYLAHVRQGVDRRGEVLSEYAAIIANRLPQKGGMTSVHLVSLENRYSSAGEEIDYLGANDDDTVRLISLHSWRFSSLNPTQSLSGILQKLNTYQSPQDNLLRISLPNGNKNAEAKNNLEQGFVPLPHKMRNGDKGVSWYHGPLATGKNPNSATTSPTMASDSHLEFHTKTGLFDVSYAAAWELGRLMTLQNKRVSQAIYNWGRELNHHPRDSEENPLYRKTKHRPLHPPLKGLFDTNDTKPKQPAIVEEWRKDLILLKGVPFSYLVPDSSMLPEESIKFFTIDYKWILRMQEGALSLSGTELVPDLNHNDNFSGFILRSSAVSGWPDLQIEAYEPTEHTISASSINYLLAKPENSEYIISSLSSDLKGRVVDYTTIIEDEQWLVHVDRSVQQKYVIKKENGTYIARIKNKILRREKLSPNVLICIFEGQANEVDIFQKPETLHFGVDRDDSEGGTFYKNLKDRQGGLDGKKIAKLPFRNLDSGVLNISDLANGIKSQLGWEKLDSALFAIEMTEGVDRIKFMR